MSDVIELYEKYKKRKSGSLVLSWAEFDKLLQHIENKEWNAEENPHPTYEYQGDKVVLHLWMNTLTKLYPILMEALITF